MAYEISEVLSETHHRDWTPQDGSPLYFFRVKTTDGVEAEAAKKKPDTPPRVGDKYKTLRQPNDPKFLATLQGPITDYQGNSGGKSYEADPKKLRSENARSALHAAKDLVVAGKIEFAQMAEVTGKLYDYVESKAKVGE